MSRQTSSWFHGWKITLRCTEFKRQDGTSRFVSSAFLRHPPAPRDHTRSHQGITNDCSTVHTDEAFSTCEEAGKDVLMRAKRQIVAWNTPPVRSANANAACTAATEMGQDSDECLAARFEVTFDGMRYAFRQFHYDRFVDALHYARTEHAKADFHCNTAFHPSWMPVYRPTDDEQHAMDQHGISYRDGVFLYGEFRYTRLQDALAFAVGHPNH